MSRPGTIRTAMTLALGVALGWALAGLRPVDLLAQGPSRYRFGDSAATSGPVSVQYNKQAGVQITQDAVYYLDYAGARLLAAVPARVQVPNAPHQMLCDFAERDLMADFQVPAGVDPHFLMTTAQMGSLTDGGAPLFVFETSTRQVAVYKVKPLVVGQVSRPRFEMIDRKPVGIGPPAAARRG